MPRIARNVGELLGELLQAKYDFGHSMLAWRGHGNSAWPLETTLHRFVREKNYDERRFELTAVNEFVTSGPSRDASFPPMSEPQRLLVAMRHHGLPVRLLDWTWNPLVATYFAVENCSDQDAAIWGLELTKLNKRCGITTGLSSLFAKDDPTRAIARFPFEGTTCPDAVIAVAAPESSRRIAAQQGLFTLHGTATPIQKMAHHEEFLVQITIPAAAKEGIKKDLGFLGISRKHLFPDLDALCADIRDAQRG